MPNQVLSSVENNFTKGLITEFTGLNFPENAATDTDNCVYTLVGDVTRRNGIDYETNHAFHSVDRTNVAMSMYKWDNAGGDGLTQIVVKQVGSNLYFYKSSAATEAAPLSNQLLVSTVDLTAFVPSGMAFIPTLECDYADGNGYLFVYQPTIDPIYCTFSSGTITANLITVKIRDFIGVLDPNSPLNSTRPNTLSQEHLYNLTNQGWTAGAPWSVGATSVNTINLGSQTFTGVPSGISATNGDAVNIYFLRSPGDLNPTICMSGSITSYTSGTGTMVVNVFNIDPHYGGQTYSNWIINPVNIGYISTWHTAEGNYPSNADVWWYFKDSTETFNPATTQPGVSIGSGKAPRGHYILNAFNMQRQLVSAVTGITNCTAFVRPRTGTWFQGRVWYTGLDASQALLNDIDSYTWTENIYFSQIVNSPADFGSCYQVNDPTSEALFDLLPSDGGVIQIQGSGSIYKLFPLQNALLVFAANGVWYITGSTGIGFTANDYTIVKLSAVKSISSSSFVNVNGLPYFWNEEGIYAVEPAKQGTSLLNSPLHVNPLEVNPVTVGTILSFYDAIPIESKKHVRGAYNPIDYVIHWTYKSTNSTSVTDLFSFDRVLIFNTYNKAFYPYSLDITSSPTINGVVYVSSPGGTGAPNSVMKYLCSIQDGLVYDFTFAEEIDDTFVDWNTASPVNFTSFFTTGYKLHGQGQRRFQIPYIYMYSRVNEDVAYKIQSIWDYAISGNSGRWSSEQLTNITAGNFGVVAKRHRLRGQGLTLQIKVTSVDGQPFDIMGWSSFETQNTGV